MPLRPWLLAATEQLEPRVLVLEFGYTRLARCGQSAAMPGSTRKVFWALGSRYRLSHGT
jgi:hypothetical protein